MEWDEPFTWPDHDILYYQVAEVPDGGSEQVFNITDLFHTYTATTPGAETCQVVNFVVTAISDVGVSEPGVAMEGLPMGQFHHKPLDKQLNLDAQHSKMF